MKPRLRQVGQGITSESANWNFGPSVAKSFDKHVLRSIPLYKEGHDLVCSLSDFFCLPNSTCYELGSATGQLTKKLALHNEHKSNVCWVGIDCEQSMVEEAKKNCQDISQVNFLCENILEHNFKKSDFIVSYYTLQFIPPRKRQDLLNQIYETLNWGGAFVLFEKVRAPDARFQDIMSSLYTDFKEQNGFTAEEILSKAQSLKGVLEPFSTQGNLDLLSRAGFVDTMSVMKHVCWEGFLAIK